MDLQKPIPYIPVDDSISEFYMWKQARKKYIAIIGPQLLTLSNDYLIQIFKKWENISRMNLKSKQFSKIMVGLFHLSMVFYFHRSLTPIDDLVPQIQEFTYSKSRCICKTSAKMLLYLSKNTLSGNKINFFHEFFSDRSWMSFEPKSSNVFQTLTILNEANSLAPMTVRSIVTPHLDFLLSLAFSDDFEIQDASFPIISHHFAVAEDQFSSLSIIPTCLKKLTNKSSLPNIRGALNLIKTRIKLHLQQEQILSIITKFSDNFLIFQNQNILLLSLDILIQIFTYEEISFLDQNLMHSLIITLINCVKKNPDSDTLDKFYEFLELIPIDIYPKNELIELASNIFSNHVKLPPTSGYYFVYLVCKRFTNFNSPVVNKIPYDQTFSKYFYKLLKLKPSIVLEYRKKLEQFFGNGFSSNLPEEQIVSRLKVARACGALLWGSKQNLIDQVKELRYSPSERVRKEVIKVLNQYDAQANLVISQALFDQSAKVRLASLKNLKNTDALVKNSLIPTLLADESVEVLSEALSLVSKLCHNNPMFFITYLYSFFKKLQKNYLRGPSLFEASKISKLFPELAMIFVDCDAELSRSLVSFCFFVLMRKVDSIIFDTYINQELLNPFELTGQFQSLKSSIVRLVHLPFLDICDINFLKTIEILKDYVTIDSKKLQIFHSFITEKRSNNVIIASLHTLTSLMSSIFSFINIDFIKPYFDVLMQYPSRKVALAVFEFLGTAGISFPPPLNNEILPFSRTSIIDFSKTKVINWLFESLVSLVPNQLPSFFEAAANTIVFYPSHAPQYMGKLIPEFVRNLVVKQNDVIVNQLISITKEMKNFMTPFLTILHPILFERLDNERIVKFCRVLSYILLNNFIPFSGSLYHKSASLATSLNDQSQARLLKQLLKFMSFSVIFQNQPIEVFLDVIEKVAEIVPDIVINELIRILQNTTITFGSSWITRIFIKVRNHPSSNQLLYSIAIFGGVSYKLLQLVLKKYSINDENFNELEKKSINRMKPLPFFVATVKASLKEERIQRQDIEVKDVFSSLVPPVNNNIQQWIQDFVNVVVSNSPNRGIRCCSDLANQSVQFRNLIIAPAFLTCWVVTPSIQQEKFLVVFRYIIENFTPLPEILFRFIDLSESCRINLSISYRDLAHASQFPAQALHYWKCYFRKTSSDIELYLSQCLKMGLIDTARGVLHISMEKNGISHSELWSEKLGNWSAALKKYKLDNNITGIIRCYGNLENWIKILKFEHLFNGMSDNEKMETSLWFGLSFFHQGNISKAEYFLQYFPENETRAHFFLRCFIYIKNGEYGKARMLIDSAQQNMTNDHSMFDGTDTKAAEAKLLFSQHLIELLEVINAKENKDGNVVIPIMWKLRQPIEERTNDSKILTNIRSLLYSDEMKLETALKMAHSLRKGRKFEELKGAYFRLVSIKRSLDVHFEGIKMLWCKNLKSTAITFLELLIGVYEKKKELQKFIPTRYFRGGKTSQALFNEEKEKCNQWLLKKFRKIPQKSMKYFTYFKDDFLNKAEKYAEENPISEEKLAQFKTLLVNWKLQEMPQTINLFFKYHKILNDCLAVQPNNLKTLFAFSLLNVRILDIIQTDKNKYALDAVVNFLKLIELSPSNDLSALLLLLDVLLKCANDLIMNQSNIEKLKKLPLSLVSNSLPQFVNLLAHPCKRLRNVVRQILLEFGNHRFQKLFFPLNIGMLSKDSNKASNSREIFNTLRKTNSKIADDLILFSESMNRAAVSLLEEWKYGIEEAIRLYEKNDIESSMTILRKLIDRLLNPVCDLDISFGNIIREKIGTFIETFNMADEKINKNKNIRNANNREEEENEIECEYYKDELNYDYDPRIMTVLWSQLRRIFSSISEKLNSLATISLFSVSEELMKRQHDLLIFVPGTHDSVRITSFESNLQVYSTAYHPRSLSIYDEKGKKHNFLLKGNCDVRIDYRIMQFFLLINNLLAQNRSTSHLSITQYSIVPLTKNSGLISWVENSKSLHQIINMFPKNRMKEQEIINDIYGDVTNSLTSPQLLELYDSIANSRNQSELSADEIDQFIWLNATTSSIWIKNNHMFVSSSALMSIAGYIIGLGDRHPNNILMQNHNGKVAHIDFGDAFEITVTRTVYPEKVPFRLTRMIVNAFDGSNPFGIFEKTCCDVLGLIREAKQIIMAQFELFTDDTTIANNPKFGSAKITKRVKEKLNGLDSFLINDDLLTKIQDGSNGNDDDVIHYEDEDVDEINSKALSVENQVRELIEIAQDPNKYATHFIGWRAYW